MLLCIHAYKLYYTILLQVTGYQCNMQVELAYGCYTILSGERLHNFFVGVTSDDYKTAPKPGSYPLCHKKYTGTATNGQILDIQCDAGVMGQYVWIQVQGDEETLTLCEVQVFEAGMLHEYYLCPWHL